MMDLVWCFIAAMLAGIFITLVGIDRDLREIINDKFEEED